MVGHVARAAELVFEKAHQPLNRAVKQSNNKNSHLSAIASATISDSLGRLSMICDGALRRDATDLRGCFRLLAGREAVASIEGTLSADHVDQVVRALGPDYCVRAESNPAPSCRRDGTVAAS